MVKLTNKRRLAYGFTVQEGMLRVKLIHPDGQEERLRRKYRRLQLVDKNLVLASEDEWRVLPVEAAIEVG